MRQAQPKPEAHLSMGPKPKAEAKKGAWPEEGVIHTLGVVTRWRDETEDESCEVWSIEDMETKKRRLQPWLSALVCALQPWLGALVCSLALVPWSINHLVLDCMHSVCRLIEHAPLHECMLLDEYLVRAIEKNNVMLLYFFRNKPVVRRQEIVIVQRYFCPTLFISYWQFLCFLRDRCPKKTKTLWILFERRNIWRLTNKVLSVEGRIGGDAVLWMIGGHKHGSCRKLFHGYNTLLADNRSKSILLDVDGDTTTVGRPHQREGLVIGMVQTNDWVLSRRN